MMRWSGDARQTMMALAMMLTAGTAMGAKVAVVAPGVEMIAESGGESGVMKDAFFTGTEKFAKNAKEVNEVNLDKNMLQMTDDSQKDMAGKMDFVSVRSYEYAKEGDYSRSDVEEFRNRIPGDWSHVVHVHEEKEDTDVWMKSDPGGQTSEMVVITVEPRELNFVHLKGHMSLRELSKMGAKYGAPTPPGIR